MRAAGLEGEVRADGQVLDRLRDEHLAAFGQLPDAGRDVYRDSVAAPVDTRHGDYRAFRHVAQEPAPTENGHLPPRFGDPARGKSSVRPLA